MTATAVWLKELLNKKKQECVEVYYFGAFLYKQHNHEWKCENALQKHWIFVQSDKILENIKKRFTNTEKCIIIITSTS